MAKRIRLELQNDQLYLNVETADIYFECESEMGQCEHIPAHKLIMIIASEKFKEMFHGQNKMVYEIANTTAESFKEFLQLIYMKEAKLTAKNAIQVMSLVNKFKIKDSSHSFKVLLKNEFANGNVCWGYRLAHLSDMKYLKKMCEEEIMWNATQVFKSTDFLACTHSDLRNILQMDCFACSESLVFGASLEWAKSACERQGSEVDQVYNLRQMLGDILYKIRFRSMTLNEFATQIAPFPGLFLAREFEEILQIIRLKRFKPNIFSGKLRLMPKYCRDSGIMCQLDRKLAAHSRPYTNTEVTTFSANKPLLFGGFDCLAIKNHALGHLIPQSKLIITENRYDNHESEQKPTQGFVVFEEMITLNENGIHHILSKSIRINPGYKYEIRFEQAFNEVFLKDVIFEQTNPKQIKDLNIHFYNDDGLISAIYFNRL